MKSRKKILLVDMANLGIRTGMSEFKSDPINWLHNWKTAVLEKLVEMIQKTDANSVVLCQEGKRNWRFDVFDQYKSHRKEEKAKAKMDYEAYYPMFDDFCDKLKQYLPNIYQLKVERAEGDDIIAVLTKNFTEKNDVICVSTDRDFYQLYKFNGYKQYNPIKRNYVQVLDPERYLLEKIVVGDKGDGVPHVKSRVSVKTAATIVENGLEEWIKKEKVQKEYERNKTLIDFECIPADVQHAIMLEFKKSRFAPMAKRDFSEFINAIGCGELLFECQEYANTFCRMERIDA